MAQLWPLLFDRYGLEIVFAHRTFAWGSDARGTAHVHVVILGLTRREDEPAIKRLFSYERVNSEPVESPHSALSPYLFDASNLTNRHSVVIDTARPVTERPRMMRGVQSTDGGHYIFRGEERAQFLKLEPAAEKFMRPYIGSEEFINGKSRWILFLEEASAPDLRAMPHVIERIQKVREFRSKSQKPATQKIAATPTLLEGRTIPQNAFLIFPRVSSERRDYAPIGWDIPPAIPSDAVTFGENATLWHFAILTSRMHMAWLRHIGGRLKSDYRYSIGIVYNTFPWPQATDKVKAKISALAQAVLDARMNHKNATLADLYDPDAMPTDLRKAHKALDTAVDKLYCAKPFASDRERVEHLFGLYEKLAAPLTALASPKPKRSKKHPL